MSTEDMAWIPGGEFQMGSSNFYPEEQPTNKTTVNGFWIDKTPVTKTEFARFVEATDYKSVAERALDPEEYSKPSSTFFAPVSSNHCSRLQCGRSGSTVK